VDVNFEEALRVATLAEAAEAVLTMWDEAQGDDGYLNQADAYYRLYKGKTPLYEALRLALRSTTDEIDRLSLLTRLESEAGEGDLGAEPPPVCPA
jgi:hypothetical protein